MAAAQQSPVRGHSRAPRARCTRLIRASTAHAPAASDVSDSLTPGQTQRAAKDAAAVFSEDHRGVILYDGNCNLCAF